MSDEPNLLNPEQGIQAPPEGGERVDVQVEANQEQVEGVEPSTEVAPLEGQSEVVEEQEISEVPTAVVPNVVAPIVQKDQITKDIEAVLAADLTDVFLQLAPEKRLAFKEAGERVAQKISIMMQTGKVQVRRMLDLIRDWLRLVPGVNKYFLEQEAKIKADTLIAYYAQSSTSSDNVV